MQDVTRTQVNVGFNPDTISVLEKVAGEDDRTVPGMIRFIVMQRLRELGAEINRPAEPQA